MSNDTRWVQFRGMDSKPILFNKEHILFVTPDYDNKTTLIYLATPIDFMNTQGGPTEFKIVTASYEEVVSRLIGYDFKQVT